MAGLRLAIWDLVVLAAYVAFGVFALVVEATDWAIFALVGATALAGIYAAWRFSGGSLDSASPPRE